MFGPYAKYARPYKKLLSLGIFAIAIAQAAGNYIPMLVKDAIDVLDIENIGKTVKLNLQKIGLKKIVILNKLFDDREIRKRHCFFRAKRSLFWLPKFNNNSEIRYRKYVEIL